MPKSKNVEMQLKFEPSENLIEAGMLVYYIDATGPQILTSYAACIIRITCCNEKSYEDTINLLHSKIAKKMQGFKCPEGDDVLAVVAQLKDEASEKLSELLN